MKSIILCADDYGLNASVSQGIIELIKAKRLSAVSCMSNSPAWPEQATWLKPFEDQVDVGLHFNLTEGLALSQAYRAKYGASFSWHPLLIIKAFLRSLDVSVLEAECEAQLQRFQSELGFLPDFIDGHQHVHQLPQVREAVLRVYERHLRQKNGYLRSVSKMVKSPNLAGRISRELFIYLCGSPGFQKRLAQLKIPHNEHFAGVYSFAQAGGYAQVFSYFLRNIADKGLIMCHPGLKAASESASDPHAVARVEEFNYFSSAQFEQDCLAAGVQLLRFNQLIACSA